MPDYRDRFGLKNATNIQGNYPNPMLGLPFKMFAPTGSWAEQSSRNQERMGLPGTTPIVDPRMINTSNNPMMSIEGLSRGDIQLPSGNPPYPSKPREDIGRLEEYYNRLKELGLSGAINMNQIIGGRAPWMANSSMR